MLLLVLLLIAVALGHEEVRMHEIPSAPLSRAHKERALVTLSFAVAHKKGGPEALKRRLALVSDIESPSYGRWLSARQVDSYLDCAENEARIRSWLEQEGVAHRVGKRQIHAQVTVARAEKLLTARFALYGGKHIRADSYGLPSHVAPAVAFVGGVHRIARPPRVPPRASQSLVTTPQTLFAQLNISASDLPAVGANSSHKQAVASFLGQFYDPNDVAAFRAAFDLPPMKLQSVGPNPYQGNRGIEASLDAQFLSINNVHTVVWSTQGEGPDKQEPFLKWLEAVAKADPQPLVWSISYQDLEPTVSPTYMKHVDNEFAGMVARGITLGTGSGDWGTQCMDSCSRFQADFPSSSPHMLSAGALNWGRCTSATCTLESAATSWSSGGFSDVFPRPSYQDKAVASYMSRNSVPTSYFNASGRLFPDWSTVGVDFQVYVDGTPTPVGGTSASTPSTMQLVSLLNVARLAAGKPPMGFIHPFLYKVWEEQTEQQTSFLDITRGNNQYGCCSVGFDALTGPDPITGLGVPQFQELKRRALER